MPTCWWLWPLTQDELERVHCDLNAFHGALLVQRQSWGGDLRDVHPQICWEERMWQVEGVCPFWKGVMGKGWVWSSF